jgi:hypothetical protein
MASKQGKLSLGSGHDSKICERTINSWICSWAVNNFFLERKGIYLLLFARGAVH